MDLGLMSLQQVLVSECTSTFFPFTNEIALLLMMYFYVPYECLFLQTHCAVSVLYWSLRATYRFEGFRTLLFFAIPAPPFAWPPLRQCAHTYLCLFIFLIFVSLEMSLQILL